MIQEKGGKPMYAKLKEEIKNIITIVKECPEELQAKCFEILLTNFLKDNSDIIKKADDIDNVSTEQVLSTENIESEKNDDQFTDAIVEKDFHVKVVKFFTMNKISVASLNKIYYKENGRLMPYYESMHSTKMSECQVRLTLLTAFENGFNTGEFTVKGEDVRKRCQELKCYDSPNFATTFKTNSGIFDNLNEKYDKNIVYTISSKGKEILAKTLKALIAQY